MILEIDTTCFKPSYQKARSCLIDSLKRLPARLMQHQQAWKHPLTGPDKKDLQLDWFFLSQNPSPEKLLILISATHGVEGFTGSAIQSHSIPQVNQLLDKHSDLGVIIIHALNPWGFAWLRRYDHEGIDINRNFIDFEADLTVNRRYEELHRALLEKPYQAVAEMFKHYQELWGKDPFIEVITRGQYQYPDGLFYGGSTKSWSRTVLEDACQNEAIINASKIAVIDLHTGLGPYGYGEVINDHLPDTSGFNYAKQWYGANAQSSMLGESYSAPKSGLLDYHWHSLLGNRGCFVTLEFGTYRIEELLTTSIEEQRYHNSLLPDKERDINNDQVNNLLQFFYPQDIAWKEMVLFRANQIISMAVQGLLE